MNPTLHVHQLNHEEPQQRGGKYSSAGPPANAKLDANGAQQQHRAQGEPACATVCQLEVAPRARCHGNMQLRPFNPSKDH